MDATNSKQWMTMDDLSNELDKSKSTLYSWRSAGTFPISHKLPCGGIRVRRTDFENWMSGLEEAA